MKIAFIQAATILGEPQKNRGIMAGFLQRTVEDEADIVLLPETWDVGFIPENVAELAGSEEDSESLHWMKEWAKQHKINLIGGSIPIQEGEGLVNRSYVIDRSGVIVYRYEKMHLFSPGKEAVHFTSGQQNSIFELEGIKCALQICYDIRFPELARKQALAGAEILFVPAQWPHPRANHWVTLNKARAIENQLYVVCTNGCGTAGKVISCGNSAIYDPWGEEVVRAGEKEGYYCAVIDVAKVEEARGKIPVFQDRRAEMY